MTMAKFKRDIQKNYPPVLSLANVTVILRISKRKAAWMLQNGIIKCTITDNPTRKYQIAVEDIFDYMERVEKDDPTVRVPTGLFNAKPTKQHREATLIAPSLIHARPPEDYKLFLADKWYKFPDLLHSEDVAEITGYTQKTAQKWITEKKLRSVLAQDDLFTTKEWLIEFYQQRGHTVSNKCKRHILLLHEYYNQAQ